VQRVGSARTAIYSNVTPVVAILVAWVALGDRLALLQWLGAVVVIGGLLLTRRGRVHERPAEEKRPAAPLNDAPRQAQV